MAGEARRRRLRALLRLCGAAIDPDTIDQAFVHESASREGGGPSYERLEFLGDAILGYVAARWLFERYPNETEGELTRRKAIVVSGEACAQTARRLEFGDLLVLGHGLDTEAGRDNTSVLSDAFEAFVAALARTAGIDVAARFIETEHLMHTDRADASESDAKTRLQELTQAKYGMIPIYFERAEGPAHDRRFTSRVRVQDEIVGEGIGSSKKAAQQNAAVVALALLRGRETDAP